MSIDVLYTRSVFLIGHVFEILVYTGSTSSFCLSWPTDLVLLVRPSYLPLLLISPLYPNNGLVISEWLTTFQKPKMSLTLPSKSVPNLRNVLDLFVSLSLSLVFHDKIALTTPERSFHQNPFLFTFSSLLDYIVENIFTDKFYGIIMKQI